MELSTIEAFIKNSWTVQNNWLSQEEIKLYRTAAENLRKSGDFHQAGVAGIGKMAKKMNEIRNDEIYWLPDLSEADEKSISEKSVWLPLLSKLERLRLYLNQELWVNLSHFECQIAVYPVGGFYKSHLDQPQKGSKQRLISLVCYLNDEWSSEHQGELMLNLSESIKILPTPGRAVLFRSEEVWHEVLPTKKERWSLTCWFSAH